MFEVSYLSLMFFSRKKGEIRYVQIHWEYKNHKLSKCKEKEHSLMYPKK